MSAVSEVKHSPGGSADTVLIATRVGHWCSGHAACRSLSRNASRDLVIREASDGHEARRIERALAGDQGCGIKDRTCAAVPGDRTILMPFSIRSAPVISPSVPLSAEIAR